PIHAVSPRRLDPGDATVTDVAGRTLMPGLIDAHCHITGLSLSPKNIAYPASEIAMAAANYLRNSLMDGFTTIREAGGADYAIARLLAEGSIVGPRLFYSGRALTQTGGGADFRTPAEVNDPCGYASPFSVMSVIADGVDEVRKAAREELRRGAAQALRLRRRRVSLAVPRHALRVLGGGTAGGGGGDEGARHLRHGARLHRRGRPPVPPRGRALDRARQLREPGRGG